MPQIYTLIVGVLLLVGASATGEDWTVWSHYTHFASGDGFFSMRNNKDGSNPIVRRSDIEAARQENWGGHLRHHGEP